MAAEFDEKYFNASNLGKIEAAGQNFQCSRVATALELSMSENDLGDALYELIHATVDPTLFAKDLEEAVNDWKR